MWVSSWIWATFWWKKVWGCLRRHHQRCQWISGVSFLSWPLSCEQELHLGNHGSSTVSNYPQLYPLWSWRKQRKWHVIIIAMISTNLQLHLPSYICLIRDVACHFQDSSLSIPLMSFLAVRDMSKVRQTCYSCPVTDSMTSWCHGWRFSVLIIITILLPECQVIKNEMPFSLLKRKFCA